MGGRAAAGSVGQRPLGGGGVGNSCIGEEPAAGRRALQVEGSTCRSQPERKAKLLLTLQLRGSAAQRLLWLDNLVDLDVPTAHRPAFPTGCELTRDVVYGEALCNPVCGADVHRNINPQPRSRYRCVRELYTGDYRPVTLSTSDELIRGPECRENSEMRPSMCHVTAALLLRGLCSRPDFNVPDALAPFVERVSSSSPLLKELGLIKYP
jgi:hypothetical protein